MKEESYNILLSGSKELGNKFKWSLYQTVVGDTPQDKMLELVNVLGFYDYEVLRYDTFIKHEMIRHDAISSSKWRKADF